MADWKRLAKNLILADGTIEQAEFDLIKREILGDHLIERDEAEFIFELRNAARSAVPEFHKLAFEIAKKALLKDGTIDADEAEWLKRFILADGKVDAQEKEFLRDLAASARSTSPEFDALIKKYVG